MKIKIGIYSFSFLFILLATSCASRKFTYFQTKEERKGKIVNIPSYRLKSVIRFQPDDILGITVNVPGEQTVASDYNLPLIPVATPENSATEVTQGIGRQTFLIRKDGTIDFPVLGIIKVEGYTQGELEIYIKELLSEKLKAPSIVSVRLLNFTVTFFGEVGTQGIKTFSGDQLNLFDALASVGGLSNYGRRDDVRIYRRLPNGDYRMISVDISREDIISSPYYFLQQNDQIYVLPSRAKTQGVDVSPRYGFILGVATLAFSVYLTIKSFIK